MEAKMRAANQSPPPSHPPLSPGPQSLLLLVALVVDVPSSLLPRLLADFRVFARDAETATPRLIATASKERTMAVLIFSS